jgi:hypothetical protein
MGAGKSRESGFFLCVAIENDGFCATTPKKLSGIQKMFWFC